MRDPVVAADGHSYERSAITKWLSESPTRLSPVTGLPLQNAHLIPNHALRMLVDERRTMLESLVQASSAASPNKMCVKASTPPPPTAPLSTNLRRALDRATKESELGRSHKAVFSHAGATFTAALLVVIGVAACWLVSLYVCEVITTLARLLALSPQSSFPMLVAGIALCLAGVATPSEGLASALVVAGAPLTIASFCQGIWTVRGGDAAGALFLSHFLLCTGVFFCAVSFHLFSSMHPNRERDRAEAP